MIWGALLGYSLKRRSGLQGGNDLGLGFLQWFCLAVALVIGAGIALGHAPLIAPFQQYAANWDARHLNIIEQRDLELRMIAVEPLPFDMDIFMERQAIEGQTCPPNYFGVERILATEP